MVSKLVEELKALVRHFNRIVVLLVIVFIVIAFIITAILYMGHLRDSKIERLELTTGSLDNIIRDTLQKYQPDRAAQQLSRETIQENNIISSENNLILHQLNDSLSGGMLLGNIPLIR